MKKANADIFMITFMMGAFAFILILVLPYQIFQSSKVTVINDYKQDFEQAKADLKVCQEKKVECAPVKCEQGAFGWVLALIGAGFYAFSLYSGNKKSKELDEREKKIKQLEDNHENRKTSKKTSRNL